jgi:hypothetical protein
VDDACSLVMAAIFRGFIGICCGGKIQNMEIENRGSTACLFYFSVLKYRILRTGSTFKNWYFDN